MYSHNYKNEINDVNNSQRFQPIHTDWFHQTRQPVVPSLFEQSITTTTTTRLNKEFNSKIDEMTTTHLEKSPMRRVNIVSGPQSAFARLFPDRYRQEQEEELRQKQRSKSSDDRRYNFDQITNRRIINKNHDDDDEEVRTYPRVSFYDRENNDYLSDPTGLKSQAKSESHLKDRHNDESLARMPLNYDPEPEIIYRDNPNKVVYVQKVGVRYLKPPTPPPSGPIVIREIRSTPPQELPPFIVTTTP
jgi:hypothetical protein